MLFRSAKNCSFLDKFGEFDELPALFCWDGGPGRKLYGDNSEDTGKTLWRMVKCDNFVTYVSIKSLQLFHELSRGSASYGTVGAWLNNRGGHSTAQDTYKRYV